MDAGSTPAASIVEGLTAIKVVRPVFSGTTALSGRREANPRRIGHSPRRERGFEPRREPGSGSSHPVPDETTEDAAQQAAPQVTPAAEGFQRSELQLGHFGSSPPGVLPPFR